MLQSGLSEIDYFSGHVRTFPSVEHVRGQWIGHSYCMPVAHVQLPFRPVTHAFDTDQVQISFGWVDWERERVAVWAEIVV